MAAFYVDTSALAKRYIRETGSIWISALIDPSQGHRFYMVRTTGAEMVAALTRRGRGGSISVGDVQYGLAQFGADWRTHYRIVEIGPAIGDHAMDLAARHGLRGYDAVHLAAALDIETARRQRGASPLTLLSADTEQLQAAVAEGLATDDPNLHP